MNEKWVEIQLDSRALLRRAISIAVNREGRFRAQRAVVSEMFGVDGDTADLICYKYGFHPNKVSND